MRHDAVDLKPQQREAQGRRKGQTDGRRAGVLQQTGNILRHAMQVVAEEEEKGGVHCLSENCF